METRASELRELGRKLVKASYLKGDFVLRSGKRSNRYFDKFLFETEPALLRELGERLGSARTEGDSAIGRARAWRRAPRAAPSRWRRAFRCSWSGRSRRDTARQSRSREGSSAASESR